MSTREALYGAFEQEDKAWWYRGKEEKSSVDQVICWRLEWSRGVRKSFGDEEQLRCFLAFLKKIDDGKAWAHGKKKGEKEACSTTKEYERVIDLQHAAWLLGWFEGYSKKKGTDVCNNNNVRRLGSRVGGTAGKFYNDPEVRRRLGIPSLRESSSGSARD